MDKSKIEECQNGGKVIQRYVSLIFRGLKQVQNRGMTRGRKGLGLHHWSVVHHGEDPDAGSDAASLVGWRENQQMKTG